MNNSDALVSECRSQKTAGKTDEQLVSLLRARGCSKVESIAVLARAVGIPLGNAKEIVHFSETWADVRERDDSFHVSLEATFKKGKKS
jgi:hypothetical protein